MLYNVTKMSYYIYKICCDDLPNYNYIGSTKAFRRRKNHHKTTYNKGNTNKIYNTIRENGGWDNWRMVILEDLGEVSFTEARIKEEEYRVKLNANLNMIKCYRTEEEYLKQKKEYRENNKEQIKEQNKKYYQNNKEHISEQTKEYREKNKEQIKEYYQKNKEHIAEQKKEYREQNKEQIKEYYQKNKEALVKYKKEYYENNKEHISEQNKEKITCECGCIIRKTELTRHKKTNKHLELMKHLEKI